jgi:hypothetical protein
VGLQHATRRREGEGVRYDMAHGEGGGGRRHPLESGGGGARKKGRGEGLVWDACPWAGLGKVAPGEKEKNGPNPNE